MQNKPLVAYHKSCADGFGAAFAAWTVLGDDAEYFPMQYGESLTGGECAPILKDRDIYILDFSLPRADMDWLFANAGRVVWLDHHKTAFEMWCPPYSKGMKYVDLDDDVYQKGHVIVLDDAKSGAMLAWEYFHPNVPAPMMFKHIDDYDRWQFKIEGTKEFNKALWSYV